jgi:TonB-dependent starch-binding outer membrane protein SusC
VPRRAGGEIKESYMGKLRWLTALLLAVGLVPAAAQAQDRGNIAGTVVAEGTGQPLHGVQVSVPALGVSQVTDERGRFLLVNVPQGNVTVRFSLIGYSQATRTVTVGATTADVRVELTTDPLLLDELIVVGYGTERRRNVAGAVSSIRPDAVAREVPATSVNQIMRGRMAGVQVVQNSGTPGAAMTVRVRGSSSISGGNDPLYVIDGVPMTQENPTAFNFGFGGQGLSAVSDLNPSEIESIEILKDASAAAIYGSRASNGVVLITTKRGAAARPEINFGAYYGQQRVWRTLDMLNADQYMEIYNEGLTARYGSPSQYGLDNWFGYTQPGKEFDWEIEPGTDTNWLNEILRTAPMSSIDGSVRGGTDRIRYFVSGSSVVQEGTVRAMGYERLNGRMNLDYVPRDRLTLGTNVALSRSITNRARSDNTIYGPFANALAAPPTQPIFNEDGTYFNTLPYANPVGLLMESEAEERGVRVLGNAFAQFELGEGLTARGSVGLDHLNNRARSYDSPVFGLYASTGGSGQFGNTSLNKLTYEGTLNLNRAFGASHEFSGVIGSSYEDNVDEWHQVTGQQFPTEHFRYLTSAAQITSGSSTRNDWTLLSYFGRASYTWNQRVTGTFNIRHDGSSRFGAANRFGTFPSASVLWRIGEESFMQNQNIIGNLALRASYGLTGNQQALGNFASRGLFGGGSAYMDLPGIAPTQLANPELRWEKTSQLNLGTDFSLLRQRLALTFDYYVKETDDLLVSRPVPRTTGFASIWSNVGSMENRGFEGALTAHLLQGGLTGFNWSTTLNVSRNRNKVTALYNDQAFGGGFMSRVEVGEPLGFFYGHIADGIFQSYEEIAAHARQRVHSNPRIATAPGDIRFRDINEDGVINDDDRTNIGSPWPDYEGGLTNTMNFRNLDLTAFVQFSQGGKIYNAIRLYMDQYGSFEDNHTTRALRRWTPDNRDTDEPRAVWGDPNFNTRASSRFIEDGSYVRLKNLVLGFRLPDDLASRGGFRTARIYLQGENLWTSTNYSGFDPEVNYSGNTSILRGTDFYTLPQSRIITFGINVGL